MGMRIRKNVTCLSTDELHDLREALAALYALPASSADGFRVLAGFHGGPPTAYCRHGEPGFLTWHRAYLLAFEDALRKQRCNVTLPFWNWSSGPTTGVPEPCRNPTYVNRSGATVPNPLYAGPKPVGGQTARRATIDTTTFDDLATSAQAAMTAATFSSFSSQIDGAHGGVHVRTGGDMGAIETAGFDSIFYLHHANIDRLWADWQAAHPGPLPAAEAAFDLLPFTRPFTTTWQKGADVESVTALGYAYRRFCLILPPIRLWTEVVLEVPWEIRREMASARLAFQAGRMPATSFEVRAFLDDPKANEASALAGNAALAGTVGVFGHRSVAHAPGPADQCPVCAKLGRTDEHPAVEAGAEALDHGAPEHGGVPHDQGPTAPPPADAGGERFDVELDITAALRAPIRMGADKVSLTLVAVGVTGERVDPATIALDGIELIVE